jgi:beta-galactosidase
MNLGVQYYRPPFPDTKYWEDDFARIKDSGLNTVQLWVLWSWVEAAPGRFVFDDYDRLVEMADKHGLGVILSTIAEVQPYWIHREVPGCELVDHKGRKVVSVNRGEIHFGITPGGCFDHPEVWRRMVEFFRQTVTRFRAAPSIRGWDIWNELRWNVHAGAPVCYCDHTLADFREWLGEKHGGLDGLNRAWLRRYGRWDEVEPGRYTGLPYTEMMAFEHFLTVRANRHAKARYATIKPLDPARPVTVHADVPSPLRSGWGEDQPINRGNDWFFADDLDGVGCSNFPKWFHQDDADFGLRIECVKSAAREKCVWLSELQGGRSACGFQVQQPVDALSQQRWIWNGLACGADTIIFWCWRDEVFCSESAGFGLSGDDGLAGERLAAMKRTGAILQNHRDLIDDYWPSRPEVGVFFSPQSYYLNWAQSGNADLCRKALEGYARGLVRNSIPYAFIEEEHLDALEALRILFMPRTLVVDDATADVLERFVRAGGTLVTESECGAFGSNGLYRYPADRFTARLAGVAEVGRRTLPADTIRAGIGGRTLELGVAQWLTPWQKGKGRVLADGADGVAIVEASVGKGRLILCGAYLGEAYREKWSADFETFIDTLVRQAGWQPEIEVLAPRPSKDGFVYTKSGEALGRKVVFVFFPAGCEEVSLRLRPQFFGGGEVEDIISGRTLSLSASPDGQRLKLPAGDWRFSVLVGA